MVEVTTPPPPTLLPHHVLRCPIQYIIPGMVVVVVYTTHTFLTPHSNISPPPLTCKGSVSRECVISLLSLKLKIINRNVQYSAIANIFEYVSKVCSLKIRGKNWDFMLKQMAKISWHSSRDTQSCQTMVLNMRCPEKYKMSPGHKSAVLALFFA